MTENDQHQPHQDLSRFDCLSTEELKTLLKIDALQTKGTPNTDAIIYITKLLTERERDLDIPDARKSWQDLREYMADRPIWADEDDTGTDDEIEAAGAEQHRNKETTGRRRGAICTVVVVAATLAILVIGSLTAYACGFDLWGAVATWTKETFGFENVGAAGAAAADHQVPEQLRKMADKMAEYGLSSGLLPGYIPEGYEVTEEQYVAPSQNLMMFYVFLQDSEDSISIQYMLHITDDISSGGIYEKDNENPRIYEHNGITYYLMENFDINYAVWKIKNLECMVYGLSSDEELIKIIDSIGG